MKKSQEIKILTGWSREGGSTFSLMEVCDMFNERGMNCTMYGPHDWHLDKCSKGGLLADVSLNKSDYVISHFLELSHRPPVQRVVLSCHEKAIFPLKTRKVEGYDAVRFVSHDQLEWHGWDCKKPHVVIPNLMRGVERVKNPPKGVAGVIGTVCPLKRTHLSIERALEDKFKKVLIYGNSLDKPYFDKKIEPLLSKKVKYMGMELDKQKIYNSISCVYQSNSDRLPEAFGRVNAECQRAHIPYVGNENATTEFELWEEDKVYEEWCKFLEL